MGCDDKWREILEKAKEAMKREMLKAKQLSTFKSSQGALALFQLS